MGQYQTYYEEWVLLPSVQKTWLNNKIFWRATYILKKQTTPTAQHHGFGGNAEQQEAADERYDATVDNVARGHASTQGTAELMANTIQHQQHTIANMQQQMNMANTMPFQEPM